MNLLTETDVSKRTGIAASTLRKWRCAKVGLGPPFVRLNGASSIRYPEQMLDEWVSRFLVDPLLGPEAVVKDIFDAPTLGPLFDEAG